MKRLDAGRWGFVFLQIYNMQNSKRDPPPGGSVVWLFCCLVGFAFVSYARQSKQAFSALAYRKRCLVGST